MNPDQSNDIVGTATTENNSAESHEIKEWGQEEAQQSEQTQDDNQEPKKKDPEQNRPRKSRAQERVEQAVKRANEAERKLAEYEAKQQAQAKQSEIKRPVIDDFEDFSEYEEALEDYHAAKAEERVLARLNEREAEKSKQSRQSQMETAITSFAETHTDFDDVVQAGLARELPMPVSLDEVATEFGYDSETQIRLLYELAKDEEFHEAVSSSSKLRAARLLSERVDSWSAKATQSVTKAPPPIKPVQANATTTRDPSKMSDDEWYRAETEKRKGK